jgi:predicted Zn-dependent protease with MMP-like domain
VSAPSPAEIDRAVERAWDLLEAGAAGEVGGLLRPLLERGVADPDDRADLHHLLGMACEDSGDRRGMVAEWLEARRLDVEGDDDARELGKAEFARVVQDARDELPPEVLDRLRNVPLIADDRPSEEMVRDGTDPRILGLFHGLPMPHESTLGPVYPDTIHLFVRNLERVSDNERELKEQIRVTVLHETAHYFGFGEDELRRLGLG